MEIAESEGNLGRIKLSFLLTESLLLGQVLEKLTSLDELHDEVDAMGLLEYVVHANDERMVHLIKDQFLDLERLNRLMLNHDILADAFHCVVYTIALVFN